MLIKQEIHVFTQGVGASFGCQVGQIFFCEDSADPRVGSKSWYTAPPPPLFASYGLTTPIVHWHYRRQRQLWQWQQWRDYQTSMNHRNPQFPIANFVLNTSFLVAVRFKPRLCISLRGKRGGINNLGFLGFWLGSRPGSLGTAIPLANWRGWVQKSGGRAQKVEGLQNIQLAKCTLLGRALFLLSHFYTLWAPWQAMRTRIIFSQYSFAARWLSAKVLDYKTLNVTKKIDR